MLMQVDGRGWGGRKERQDERLWRYFSRAICSHLKEKEKNKSCVGETWPVDSFPDSFPFLLYHKHGAPFPAHFSVLWVKMHLKDHRPHSLITHTCLSFSKYALLIVKSSSWPKEEKRKETKRNEKKERKGKKRSANQLHARYQTGDNYTIYLLLLKIFYFNYGIKINIWRQVC